MVVSPTFPPFDGLSVLITPPPKIAKNSSAPSGFGSPLANWLWNAFGVVANPPFVMPVKYVLLCASTANAREMVPESGRNDPYNSVDPSLDNCAIASPEVIPGNRFDVVGM